MRRIITGLIAALLLVGICGCGMKLDFPKKSNKDPVITDAPEEVAPEEPEETAEKEPEEVEADLPVILGNGEYFLKVGNRVYFRDYDAEALSSPVLWGDYRAQHSEQGKKAICYLEDGSDAVVRAFEDEGYGPLYGYKDRLYGKDDVSFYSVKMDGSGYQRLSLGSGAFSFFAIVREYMFFEGYPTEGRSLICKEIETDRDVVVFRVPESGYGYPTISQVEISGDHVYIGISYLEGSGNFFQSGEIYQAPLNGSAPQGERILEITSSMEDSEFYDMPYFTVGEDGKLLTHSRKPNSAWIQENDLYVCDGNGTKSCLAVDWLPIEYGWFTQAVEQLSYLDGNIYVIKNLNRRSREDDIGWREAYKMVKSSLIRIDSDLNETEFATVLNPVKDLFCSVFLLEEKAGDGSTLILFSPLIMVYSWETELCERYGLDPDNPDQFFDSYEIVAPYQGDGYDAKVSEQAIFRPFNFESDASLTRDMNQFRAVMSEGVGEIYHAVKLENLYYDEYAGSFKTPESDYDKDIYYYDIIAEITFSEDGSEVTEINEVYRP